MVELGELVVGWKQCVNGILASGRELHLFNHVDSLGLHRVGLMKWCQE